MAARACGCGCGRPLGVRHSRGLRSDCRRRIDWHGRLIDYPRPTRTHADTTDDATALRARGLPLATIAEHLGMRPASVVRAMERHRVESGGLDPNATAAMRALQRELAAMRWASKTEAQREERRIRRRVS